MSNKNETDFVGSLSKTLKIISLDMKYKSGVSYFTISKVSEPCATNIYESKQQNR